MLNVVHTYYNKETIESVLNDDGVPAQDWPNGIQQGDNEGLSSFLGSENADVNKHKIFSGFFQYGFKKGNFKFFSGSNIPEEKYIFPVHIFSNSFYKKYQEQLLYIPDQVVKDLQSGKARIVFITDEGEPISEDVLKMFLHQATGYNFDPKNIIYISCNYLVEATLNNGIYYNPWQFNVSRLMQGINAKEEIENIIFNQRTRDKKYLCFNRMSRAHRHYLIFTLLEKNLDKEGIVTYAKLRTGPRPAYDEYGISFKAKMPMTYDIEDLNNIKPKTSPININVEAHNKCYFNVVTESFYGEKPQKTMFFSEKIFKPIICLQPFILVGQQYGLKALKQMGYKTFNGYIDESYDEISHPTDRLNAIIKEVEKICEMSHEELSNMLVEMYPILLHNFTTHVNLTKENYDGTAIINKINNIALW